MLISPNPLLIIRSKIFPSFEFPPFTQRGQSSIFLKMNSLRLQERGSLVGKKRTESSLFLWGRWAEYKIGFKYISAGDFLFVRERLSRLFSLAGRDTIFFGSECRFQK